jgi:acyl-CoA synthetase (AMP-forming)/AMP-acid ligase II
MPRSDVKSLREGLVSSSHCSDRFLSGAAADVSLIDLARGSTFGGREYELSGQSVLVATQDQLTTALALIGLDGIAARLTICPPDLPSEYLSSLIADVSASAVVYDHERPHVTACADLLQVSCSTRVVSVEGVNDPRLTEWVLLTSGTTGTPKTVVHSLASLTITTKFDRNHNSPIVWGCLYDIRRFAGLQVFLQAVLGGGSLILAGIHEPLGDYLTRLGTHRASHISGTPSQWRRALMSPSARALNPRQITLGGEIADQAVLDNLRSFYPRARITHIYASTEAGVGFAVNDGLEGFPTSMIGDETAKVDLKVKDGSLRIRSAQAAGHYLGPAASALTDDQGFVDTGDNVELRGDRYYFLGRRGGIINVGGLKVHPEEVEAVINRHPGVQMSLVRSRKNPITGSIVIAEVVLRREQEEHNAGACRTNLKRDILGLCRRTLAEHKIPAAIHFVSALDIAANGKLVR